jgi:DNA primase
VTLDDLLTRLHRVSKCGAGYVACCPAHDDRHPSLSIGVGATGRILVHCFAGCAPEQIVSALGLSLADFSNGAGRVSQVAPRRTRQPTAHELAELRSYALDCCARLLDRQQGGQALGYLAERFGIGQEDAGSLGLGYDPGRDEISRPPFLGFAFRRPRLVVPLALPGRLVSLQARGFDVREPRWASPASPPAWGRVGTFALNRSDPVVLCEGPSDALAAVGAGLAVAFVRGAALCSSPTSTQRTLDPLLPVLRGRHIVVTGDGDEAGRQFSAESVAFLASAGRIDARTFDPGEGLDLARLFTRDREGTGRRLRSLFWRAVA